jgi:predicted ester cyclase
MTGRVDSERNMKMACRWFTEGWAGNIELADDIFSESVRTNGVAAGVAGPKRRIQERLAGFPDLSVDIEDMFSVHDKIVTRLVWRGTHTGSYAGIKALGKRVQVPDFASWRFEDGKVVELSTIQDQFALLKQAGYLPGDVCAA